jgi:hypothetical protein
VKRVAQHICACVIAGSVALVLAPGASAAITPALTLDQSHGTSAGATLPLGMDLKFAPSSGDSPKDLTISFPPGLISDASINNGACLHTTTATDACKVGSGTVTATELGLPVTLPVTFHLVAPPKPGDLAGVVTMMTVLGSSSQLGTAGDVTLRGSGDPAGIGLNIALTNLPNTFQGTQISLNELVSNFDGLRLPTSCPSPSATLTVSADSYSDPTVHTTSAPLTVTGCSKLPFTPSFHLTATRDAGDPGVQIVTEVTQPASPAQATSKSVQLTLPAPVLAPNAGASSRVACANIASGTCTPIGSATSVSPLYPVPLNGKVYLLGTLGPTGLIQNPAITIAFPPPFAITLAGTVDLATNSTTFVGAPDIPQTQLTVTLNGGTNAVFLTTCAHPSGTASSTQTSQDGDETVVASSPFTVVGCPGKQPPRRGRPRLASVVLKGLAHGSPTMSLRLLAGSGAPKLRAFTVTAPKGLSFVRRHRRVTGVSASAGGIRSVSLNHGRLVVRLRNPVRSVTLRIGQAALRESASLRAKAKRHQLHGLKVKVTFTDASGATTTASL